MGVVEEHSFDDRGGEVDRDDGDQGVDEHGVDIFLVLKNN